MRHHRLFGCFAFLVGSFVTYECIYVPITDAAAHEKAVHLSIKGTILCPLTLIYGLTYLALGKRAEDIFGTREHPSAMSWFVGIGLLVAGFFLYEALKDHLTQAGYQF